MSESTGWDDDSGRVATLCDVTEKPLYSKLLGPDGNPLKYAQPKVGFNLNKKENTNG